MLQADNRKKTHYLPLSEVMPLVQVLDDDKTILTENGLIIQTIRISGIDTIGLKGSDQIKLQNMRENMFRELPEEVGISLHIQRKPSPLNAATDDLGCQWANKINALRHKDFLDAYRTEITLVISLKLHSVIKSHFGIGSKTREAEETALNVRVNELSGHSRQIIEFLKEYNPEFLRHTRENDNPLIQFWSYIINGGIEYIPTRQNNYLGRIIGCADIDFSGEGNFVRFVGEEREHFCAFYTIKYYPDSTDNHLLDVLLRLKQPFNIVQHIIPEYKEALKSRLRKRINELESYQGFTGARLENMAEAAHLMEANALTFQSHIFSLCVYGSTPEELEENSRGVKAALAQSGINLIREGVNIQAAFWAQFPDYVHLLSSRKVLVSTANLAHFNSFSGNLEGFTSCSWGNKPIAQFKTTNNTVYSLTLHASPAKDAVAHTILFGDSGSGKSTFLSLLTMNCLKYQGIKILGFDSYNGLKIPVSMLGGSYIDAGQEGVLQLNPMMLPDKHSNRQFLEEWIGMLAGGALEEDERAQVIEAIRQNYLLAENDRSLHEIRTLFGRPGKNPLTGRVSLYDRLKRWFPNRDDSTKSDSPYGLLFNSSHDSLKFDKRLVFFDMGTVLKKQDLLGPLSSYIFHAFGEHITDNPGPHLCIIDEMARYLADPTFGPFILKANREWRKRNGAIIGAVQEPSVLTKSAIGKDILQNTATYIIFPNAVADAADYITEMGLTESEYMWVKTPTGKRQVMVKRRGGASVVLNIDLSGIGGLIHLLSSSADYVKMAEEAMRTYPENWEEYYLSLVRMKQ